MLKRLLFYIILIFALAIPASAEQLEARGMPEDSLEPVRLPIVMYHQMSPKEKLWGDYVISPGQFECDLQYLKENGYKSISLAELLAWSDGTGTLPEKPVMITFDDGYESTAVYAGPLLEKYGYTAVVAVIGSVCQYYTDYPDHMLDYAHMGWDAVKEVQERGTFEIQCHTWEMHKLDWRRGCGKMPGEDAERYKDVLRNDLWKFFAVCEEQGIKLCGGIAYPFGSWDDETLEVVREMGFRAAFTCGEAVNVLSGDTEELYHLGRFNRPNRASTWEFFARWQ